MLVQLMNEKLEKSLINLVDNLSNRSQNGNSSELSSWEKSKVIANWLAVIAVPLVLGLTGYFVNLTIQESTNQTTLIEIATDILKSTPSKSDDEKSLRRWAIETLNAEAKIKFSDSAKELLETTPLPRFNGLSNYKIGVVTSEMDALRTTLRNGESAFGNLIADAMLEAYKEYDSIGSPDIISPHFSMIGSKSIRSDKIYKANTQLTRLDIIKALPFTNNLVLLSASGQDILSFFNKWLSKGHPTPQISGMKLVVKRTPSTMVVGSIEIAQSPIELGNIYYFVASEFEANAYLSDFKKVEHRANGRIIADAVMLYVLAQRQLNPKVEGRVIIK